MHYSTACSSRANPGTEPGMTGSHDSERAARRRSFCFLCGQCDSPLEAGLEMIGRSGRCPRCGAEFEIPAADARKKRIVARRDDADETPSVHAYASDGRSAPRIVNDPDAGQAILCAHCGSRSAIDADCCSVCARPFTMAGVHSTMDRPGATRASVCLTMGILSLPAVACAWGIGASLALGAICIGWAGWTASRSTDRTTRRLILIGLLCSAAAMGTAALRAAR